MSDTPKPTLSERDLSFNTALAGAKAKDEAAELGGDPAHMRSLVAAARDGSALATATPGSKGALLMGFPLRQDDLLVTLCLNLYKSAFGADPSHQIAGMTVLEKTSTDGKTVLALVSSGNTPETEAVKMQAIAALAFIFTQAEDAWELLDLANDPSLDEDERKGVRRDFIRAALEFGGSFTQADTDALITHVARLMRRTPDAEGGPGKQERPAS